MTTEAINLKIFLQILIGKRAKELAALKQANAALRLKLSLLTIKWGTTLYRLPTR